MLKGIIRKIYVLVSNKKNGTIIKSNKASIKAKYGKGVLIDQNTIVDADVEIGEYSYINKNSSVENCVIGKYCSISSGVYIGPFEHNLSNVSTHPFCYENGIHSKRKKVIIGNDVLISLNSIILEGVKIGDGAVIGAGAVVTNDVKPYEIVGGVPARHIKYRFEQDDIEYLEKIKWWDWNREEIVKLKEQFHDIHGFIENCKRIKKEK